MGWDKGRGSEHRQKGAGLGGSERPRLKVWLPLNSGLFGIQLKAKGGGSPMGGEVTGIGRGDRALGASSSHVPPPPPLVCTLTLEAGRGESPTRPHLASRPGTQRPRAGRRERQTKLSAKAGGGGANPKEEL